MSVTIFNEEMNIRRGEVVTRGEGVRNTWLGKRGVVLHVRR